MAFSHVGLPVDGAGKKVETWTIDNSGTEYHREVDRIGGAHPNEIVAVKNSDPDAAAYGAIVRPALAIFPIISPQSSSNLAAGASTNLDSIIIANATTGNLQRVTVASSAPCKWTIQKSSGGVPITIDVLITSGVNGTCPTLQWEPPDKSFATQAGNGTTSFFRVVAVSLEARNSADVFCCFFFDEVAA